MANPSTIKETAPPQPVTAMSVVAPAIGWLIPGAGHLIQKRWIRGLLIMGSIVVMFLLGLAMQGRVYRPNGAIFSISLDSWAMWEREDCIS